MTTESSVRGPRFVVVLYLLLVSVGAGAGFLTALTVEGLRSPRFLFLVPFPPTPFGFAAYGGLTLAVALGVPLGLVILISRRVDGSTTRRE